MDLQEWPADGHNVPKISNIVITSSMLYTHTYTALLHARKIALQVIITKAVFTGRYELSLYIKFRLTLRLQRMRRIRVSTTFPCCLYKQYRCPIMLPHDAVQPAFRYSLQASNSSGTLKYQTSVSVWYCHCYLSLTRNSTVFTNTACSTTSLTVSMLHRTPHRRSSGE